METISSSVNPYFLRTRLSKVKRSPEGEDYICIAAELLVKKGFKVYNLDKGILNWIEEGREIEK